ncbi:MAG: 23S rRNA (adenine(2503)-C(2))-methyltransferase RlmN [Candidatus Marinimicrobia bacterium]|nr:23S rRNA (adenine(2503)-C(2))-methyltransferase RlmN [Candidatus Neomarinimicrobiota bacterium]
MKKVLKSEPKYRLTQAKEAVFKNLVKNWSEAVNLPAKIIDILNKECPLGIKGDVKEDGDVKKAIITLEDGLQIESVLMQHSGNRNTVCVSSQVGCPMGCKFCATGSMGLKRNLTTQEIVNQVLFFARILKENGQRVSNIVFMGMGEPFLNYDNVLEAARVLNDKEGLDIGARKISISTCGIIEGIEKLTKEDIQVNLAISLHAPEDELRSKLMPVNKKYSLEEVLEAVDNYIKETSRQVMFEYLLLKDVNDTREHAQKLAKLLCKPLYFLNLIIYNPTEKEGMAPSPLKNVKEFKEVLEKANIPFSQRYRFGGEIKAACGQLALSN